MAMHPSPVLAPLHVSCIMYHVSGNTLFFPQTGDLVSTDQPFGLSMVEYGFEGRRFDGVLGLNYPNLSFSGTSPTVDKLKNEGAISEPVFAFYLSK